MWVVESKMNNKGITKLQWLRLGRPFRTKEAAQAFADGCRRRTLREGKCFNYRVVPAECICGMLQSLNNCPLHPDKDEVYDDDYSKEGDSPSDTGTEEKRERPIQGSLCKEGNEHDAGDNPLH